MIIKIIGSNTINGIKLRKSIIKVVNQMEGRITINLIEDNRLKDLPHLYVNENLVSKGNIPSEKEIVKYLKKYDKD